MEKGYTKKKYRRKIPKVGRSYKRHMSEDKTFDKAKDINDLVQEHIEENNMSKSIEQEMDEMAEKMEKSTQDPKAALMKTIEKLGSEGIKKSMADLDDAQKELLKSVLEEMAKGKKAVAMDAHYDGDKKFVKLEDMGTEEENGSDDEDEKLVMQSASGIEHQGDLSPEGREGQVIKGEMGSKDAKKDKMIAEKEAKKEVKEHEKDMHKMCKADKEKSMKKSLEEVKALKEEVIKSYEEAGLEYNDELIKAEMKKRMLKEEDQVEMGGQDKGGKKDRASKPAVKEIEVGKDADETADEAVAKVGKMKKSEEESESVEKVEKSEASEESKEENLEKSEEEVKEEKIKKSLPPVDLNARLRANTGGRNYHFSIDNYYNEALAKAQGKDTEAEKLEKSEGEESVEDLNDIIEKGYDQTMCDVASEELQKSQQMGEFANSTFSDKDLADAMNVSEEELKEILGESK